MWMSSIRNIIKNKVFIIAEIGVNHNGSISIAKKSIIEAKNLERMLSSFNHSMQIT